MTDSHSYPETMREAEEHLSFLSNLPGVHPHRIARIRDALRGVAQQSRTLDSIMDNLPADRREKIEARANELAQGSWQPIDTAPKNNTRILLWYPWTGKPYKFAPAGFHYTAVWTCTDEGELAWRDPDDFELIGPDPTHWMPLPAPPSSLPSTESK